MYRHECLVKVKLCGRGVTGAVLQRPAETRSRNIPQEKMVSRCVSVAVAVLVVVVAVTAEPGFKIKGRCRPHVRYVPYYKTVVNKVGNGSMVVLCNASVVPLLLALTSPLHSFIRIPVYHTVYKEKVVPSPIHQTVYKTQYQPQYQTKYVPKYVTKSVYNTDVEYITKYDVQYQTKYETKYVPQYKTVVKTEHSYKTMVSRGVTMVAAVVVVVLAAVVSGEPGFLKGRPRCHTHVSHVPHYKTVLKKFPVYKTHYNEKYVPAPIYHTEYITKYEPQYQTEYVPEYVYTTLYTKHNVYVTKTEVKYETKYQTEYVPQYYTVTKTQETYKTVCPKSPYTPY
ncbi:hypothetical protein O3P69_018325 [Scylla paramamosain]|uniref:Uncharacterized protein n=2 Tax=Scylla paramamosain TaxID=85552 RepID=A0AAW0TJX1_SCYPA